MASKADFAEFAADRLSGAGIITYRKMFGEYGLYCNGKFFAMVCDDQLFIKFTDAVKREHPELTEAPPYCGAKNHFLIENLDDKETLSAIVSVTCANLPEPKPKNARKK